MKVGPAFQSEKLSTRSGSLDDRRWGSRCFLPFPRASFVFPAFPIEWWDRGHDANRSGRRQPPNSIAAWFRGPSRSLARRSSRRGSGRGEVSGGQDRDRRDEAVKVQREPAVRSLASVPLLSGDPRDQRCRHRQRYGGLPCPGGCGCRCWSRTCWRVSAAA